MNAPELNLRGNSGSSGQSIRDTIDYRRNFTFIYGIEEQDGKGFNEENFLGELKIEIAKKMGETGVQITGAGSNNGNFYFNYSEDKTKGWLEVVGARLEGNKYKLWCMIREEARAKDD